MDCLSKGPFNPCNPVIQRNRENALIKKDREKAAAALKRTESGNSINGLNGSHHGPPVEGMTDGKRVPSSLPRPPSTITRKTTKVSDSASAEEAEGNEKSRLATLLSCFSLSRNIPLLLAPPRKGEIFDQVSYPVL